MPVPAPLVAAASIAGPPLLQIGSDLITNALNIGESRSNRRFQRDMSNTAHQREVADLRAAGLNPVLSARLGGASTPGGSAAHLQNTQIGQTLSNAMMTKAQLDNIKSTTDLNTAQAAQVRALTPGAPGKQAAETGALTQSAAESVKRIEQMGAQIKNLDAQTQTEQVKLQKEKALQTLYSWVQELLEGTDKKSRAIPADVKKTLDEIIKAPTDGLPFWKKKFMQLIQSYIKRGGR